MTTILLTSVLCFFLFVRQEINCGLVDGFFQGLSSGYSKDTTTAAPLPFNFGRSVFNNDRPSYSSLNDNASTTQRAPAGDARGYVNNRGQEQPRSCPVMMPMKKKRFYRQVQAVRPEDATVLGEEVIFYLDTAPDFTCS